MLSLIATTMLTLMTDKFEQGNPQLIETQSKVMASDQIGIMCSFRAGWRAGYKKANPMGLVPLAPLPPLGKNTYEDGFGMGYMRGLQDK